MRTSKVSAECRNHKILIHARDCIIHERLLEGKLESKRNALQYFRNVVRVEKGPRIPSNKSTVRREVTTDQKLTFFSLFVIHTRV